MKGASHAAPSLAGLLLLGACAKHEPAPHRTEPWLAKPSASSKSLQSAPEDFHFADGSNVRFSVQGRKGKVTGHAPLSSGKLHLDAQDLKSASASVDVDLTQLVIDDDSMPPEGVEPSGSSPSVTAQQWLELGPSVAAERRAQFATARFELSSVDDPSLPFLDFGAKSPRRVRVAAIGTLLIHGFKEPVRVELALEPHKTAPGAPRQLSIHSAGALVVALAPHDVTARGPGGVADALAAGRAVDWVGKSVRLEFDLVAQADKPAPK